MVKVVEKVEPSCIAGKKCEMVLRSQKENTKGTLAAKGKSRTSSVRRLQKESNKAIV